MQNDREIRDELLKLHSADMGAEEEQALIEVLRSGWLTKGPKTAQFECEFSEYVGAIHALGTNSCTAALHLALLVAGIGEGDEVIVPALTFAATANVVVHCGATPVFADVLEDTHCIDPAHVAQLVTERTKAIIPVHFAGIPCEMDALREIADEHGLFILEDCAHAIETEYKGTSVGVAGGSRFAAYSFYATKNLICGEGGMLLCRDEADLERARVLGLHGMSADAWNRHSGNGFKLYDIEAAGFKYNMFDLQAALGLVQLRKLEQNWQRRRELALHYDALIADAFPGGEVTTLEYAEHGKSAHHLYVVKLNKFSRIAGVPARHSDSTNEIRRGGPWPARSGTKSNDLRGRPIGRPYEDGGHGGPPHKTKTEVVSEKRDRVITEMLKQNVQCYVHYPCLTGTQFYRERFGASPAGTPVSASLSARSITLPLFPEMTKGDAEYVVRTLADVLGELS